jgi:hypothetical protein
MELYESHVTSERSHGLIVLTTGAAFARRYKTATLGCKEKRAGSLFLTMDDKLTKPELTASRCDRASSDMSTVQLCYLSPACAPPPPPPHHLNLNY